MSHIEIRILVQNPVIGQQLWRRVHRSYTAIRHCDDIGDVLGTAEIGELDDEWTLVTYEDICWLDIEMDLQQK